MKKLIYLLFILLLSAMAYAEQFNWPFLDTKATGAYDFIKAHPKYDGRGVLIFIVDCGVDPAVPGLLETSTGKTKVIDIKDFSNQLVFSLQKAEMSELNGEKVLKSGDIYISGYDKLSIVPIDSTYYIASFSESKFKNSVVKDINNNGKTNDTFNFVVFKTKLSEEVINTFKGLVKIKPEDEIWVYYVDEDCDGNIDDEKMKLDYKYNFDTFNFYKGEKEKKPLLTMSAYVDNNKFVISTGDGAHGSHCAGIAAGYKIYGNDGNNGIAPGAYVASLKIGSNILSGGATTTAAMKRAYEYGIKFMKEAGFKYAVFSMSYGIGNEEPGRTDLEKFFNKFAKEHPEAVIVTSNGNEGPGINSTGNPAGAEVEISVGAMIPVATLHDLYGSPRTKNWITHFSSRGGESPKPDVVAPAGASSTVPNYLNRDVMWGTSMACPEVAGACAVLLSAALSESLEVNHFMVKKAISYTAVPLTGYTHVDYGNGLVNIPQAYKYLKILAQRQENKKILYYKIAGENTFYDNGNGPAVFWRANGYFPSSDEKHYVSVTPVFPKDLSEVEKQNFYRAFKLKSNAPWVKTDRGSIYIRGNNSARIGIYIDKAMLKSPGLYSAKIFAYPQNEKGSQYPDFDIQVTVVVPYSVNEKNNYTVSLKNQSLNTGDIKRVFVGVPPQASAMNISMSPVNDKWYNMVLYLFSPDGNNPHTIYSVNNNNKKEVSIHIPEEDLFKGTWELIPYCYYQSKKTSYYNLNVKFYSVSSEPDTITNIEIPDDGFGKGTFKIINNYNKPVYFNATGNIAGYYKLDNYNKKNVNTFKETISIPSDVNLVVLKIDMPKKEYNKVTDLAVNILDNSGKAVVSDGMSRKYHTIYFEPPASGKYTLEMVPAFVSNQIKAKNWNFKITTYFYYKDAVPISVKLNKKVLYPGIWQKGNFELKGRLPYCPDGYNTFGNIILKDNKNNLIKKIPITL